MNISPQELCNIILGKLMPDERAAAQGTFSGPSLPFRYDNTASTNPINLWFQGNITSNQQKMIIQHKDIAALLLFYNGRFQVISKPNALMDMVTHDEFIVSHFGDALNAIILVAISTLDITFDYFGLLPSNDVDNNILSHLKSSGLEVTEPIQVDGQDNVTFLQDANLTIPNDVNLGTLHVSCLPVTVPLPYGHGIASTPVNDAIRLTNLSNRLNVLNPKLSLWCSLIHMTADIFKGKSLQHDTLHINNAYFKGLDQGAIVRPTIFALCQLLS